MPQYFVVCVLTSVECTSLAKITFTVLLVFQRMHVNSEDRQIEIQVTFVESEGALKICSLRLDGSVQKLKELRSSRTDMRRQISFYLESRRTECEIEQVTFLGDYVEGSESVATQVARCKALIIQCNPVERLHLEIKDHLEVLKINDMIIDSLMITAEATSSIWIRKAAVARSCTITSRSQFRLFVESFSAPSVIRFPLRYPFHILVDQTSAISFETQESPLHGNQESQERPLHYLFHRLSVISILDWLRVVPENSSISFSSTMPVQYRKTIKRLCASAHLKIVKSVDNFI